MTQSSISASQGIKESNDLNYDWMQMPGNGKKMLLMTLNRVIIGLCRWVSISETASSDCDVFVRMKYSRWPS